MAGHSKWANIKHRKSAQDAKRGKAFTKLIKEITVVARDGGGDPSANPRLRTLMDKAKHINMPLENVTRAIKKGTGELPGVSYESHRYEGYGPNGVAVIVEVLTDNKNRSVAAIRHSFSKSSGNLAESGSVNWMFEHLGVIRVTKEKFSEDELLEKLLDFNISDISSDEHIFTVTCPMSELEKIKHTIIDLDLKIEHADLEWVAKELVNLEDNQSNKVINFLEDLEELEDVQNVYTNLA